MANAALKAVMLAPSFDKLSLADQTDAMRRAGAPDDVLSKWVGWKAKGPVMRPGGVPVERGEGDSSGDVARILEQYHEPNRVQDWGPRLVTGSLIAASAGLPEAAAGGVAALRGLSAGAKAVKIAKAAAIAGGAGAADKTLQSWGVPPWLSEAVLAAGGLATKPGRSLLRAGLESLFGETAVAESAPAAVRAATAAPAAVEAAAPIAASTPEVGALRQTADAARRTALARGATAEEAHAAAVQANLDAIRSAPPASREATARVLEPARDVLPAGQRAPATNLGGTAKPGPAPTPPDELEATLRKSLDAIAEKKGASPLQGPRIEIGAQNVGRSVGMTKEEVRQAAGPVLGETRGEASPVLPQKAFNSIYEKMKAMPVSERRAYVLLAKDTKTMGQLETMRRVFERAGLALPAGAAGFSVLRKIAASDEGI